VKCNKQVQQTHYKWSNGQMVQHQPHHSTVAAVHFLKDAELYDLCLMTDFAPIRIENCTDWLGAENRKCTDWLCA
jgi:hypothetical protein